MQVRNGSIELHVAVDGDDDAPPVLLLHGITASVRTWDWLVPELADRYRVLRLDFRGHGRSDRTPDAYDRAGYVGDAIAAIEQAAGGPCALVGHSLGGITAIGVAQQRPDLVRVMVLEDPPLAVPDPAPGEAVLDGNALLDAFRQLRGVIPHLQESGVDVDQLAEMIAGAPSAAGVPFADLLHADAMPAMAAGQLALDASVLDPVLSGRGDIGLDVERRIEAPTLLVTADPAAADCVARPRDVERFRDVVADLDVRTLSGAGHLVHDQLGQREVFAEALRSFLSARYG